MMASPSVELLLATYNSERFLAPLLESLVAQTHDDFVLVVSDDGSRDTTLEIVAQFAPRFRHPPRVLDKGQPTGSAMMNFARLLGAASADYVLLVDHDDIWHPDKVACGLAMVREVEVQRGAAHPVLAHGDLRVIDGDGAVSRPSFWAMKQIDPACSQSLRRTLIHASVVGCTTTMNRALVQACLPIPPEAVMHDWWISLIAAARGTVVYDPVPHIDYRIHGNNVSNPREASASAAMGQANYRAVMQQKLAVRAQQAAALAERLEHDAPAAASLSRRFAQLPEIGFVARRLSILRHRFLFPGVWRNLALAVAS
jgi:hypothetical protein